MTLGLNGRFYGAPVTGVQRFAREVFARLPARWPGPVTLFLPAGVRAPDDVAVTATVPGRLGAHAGEQLDLPRRARAAGCDVVLSASGTAPVRGGRDVVFIHDVFPLTQPHLFSRRFALWYRFAVRRAARRAAAIVTPSDWARSEIIRVLGVAPDRVHLAPQGTAPFSAPATEAVVESVCAKFGLAEPYVLAVGAGDRRKNVGFLLDVLAEWETTTGNAPTLVVVGARPARVHGQTARRPETAARAGEVAGRVRRLGYVTDNELHALYTAARVFCFPSLGEGFGRPPLEALACGTPAVVADYPAAREVLGRAAVLAPLERDAWMEAIGELLADGETRSKRIALGRRIAAGYDWDTAADAVAEVCCTVAARGSRVPVVRSAPVPVRYGTDRSPAARPRPRPPARVAIVHDWLTGMRGGERCLEALLELFPTAELFTLLHVRGSVSARIESRPIHTSFVQRLPASAHAYRYCLPLFPAAVERFDLTGFDLVISSSHCVAKGVRTPAGVPHLCYCHSPMRYIWDQYDAYFGPGRASRAVRAVVPLVARRLRHWDVVTAERVNAFIANSRHTAGRIGRYYGRDADVVYPPVDVDRFRPASRREDFYLIVSALVPYKRIDIAVQAFAHSGRSLVVVGDGPERRRLQALAGPGVRFSGPLPDEKVAALMGRCRAFVHPAVEDFGIAAVEAQAAGAPVIAFAAGGALETVVGHDDDGASRDDDGARRDDNCARRDDNCARRADRSGPTGLFFHEQTPAALADAVRRFERLDFDPGAAVVNARRFEPGNFARRIAARVQRFLSGPASVSGQT